MFVSSAWLWESRTQHVLATGGTETVSFALFSRFLPVWQKVASRNTEKWHHRCQKCLKWTRKDHSFYLKQLVTLIVVVAPIERACVFSKVRQKPQYVHIDSLEAHRKFMHSSFAVNFKPLYQRFISHLLHQLGKRAPIDKCKLRSEILMVPLYEICEWRNALKSGFSHLFGCASLTAT